MRWDGSVEDLPAGIDGAIARGFEEGGATALCAMVIMIPRGRQGRGLSTVTLRAMLEIARQNGLGALIAPVQSELEGALSAHVDRGLRGLEAG